MMIKDTLLAPLTLFTLLSSLLLSTTNTIVLADSTIQDECVNPDFVSYHIHVLFWPKNAEHTNGALQLRNAFIDAHFDPTTGAEKDENISHNCTMGPADPAPGHPICVFPVNMDPLSARGPFLTAEYAFFVPKDDLQRVTHWMVQHRGVYDVLIHPNTHCHVLDHTAWAMWVGNKWELDTSVFPPSSGGEGGARGGDDGGGGDDADVVVGDDGVVIEDSPASVDRNSSADDAMMTELHHIDQSSLVSSSIEEDDWEEEEEEEEDLYDDSWSSIITTVVGVVGFVIIVMYAFASIMVSFIKMGNAQINSYEEVTPTTDGDDGDNNYEFSGAAVLGDEEDAEGSFSSFSIGPVEEGEEQEEEEEEEPREIS